MNDGNKNHLEIFELCEKLSQLLGDKEAIADLKILYERHPDMFKSMQEISHTISEVVKEPDLIIKNPKSKSDKDFIAVKKELGFDNKKMGDVGISNKQGESVIFHANKQATRNFNRFEKKANMQELADGGAVRSLHTQGQALMGGNEKSNGANALSSTNKDILAKNEPTQEQISKIKEKASQIVKNGKNTESKKDFENER